MKKTYLLLLLSVVLGVFSLSAQDDIVTDASALLSSATEAYEQGDYAQAVTLYQQIIAEHGTSSALYYNLGNAYYKQRDFAHAILQYERALLLNPSDQDIQTNLEMARLQCVDKIETIQPVIFTQWSDAVRDLLSCDAWAVLSVVMFLLFIAALFLYFFMRRRAIRKVGFYTAGLALVVCLVAMYYASRQYTRLTVRDYAIIVAPTVTVRSSPAESGTALFPLHEGTKVRVKSALGEWSEIELSDGNVGWMPNASFEII